MVLITVGNTVIKIKFYARFKLDISYLLEADIKENSIVLKTKQMNYFDLTTSIPVWFTYTQCTINAGLCRSFSHVTD